MRSCDGSRSILQGLFAGTLTLALGATAFGQAAPVPAAPIPAAPLPTAPLPTAPVPPSPPTSAAPATPPESGAPAQANTTAEAPPTTPPTTPPATPPSDNGTLLAYSLASVPDMIGDSPNGGRYNLFGVYGGRGSSIPIAGGDGYAKIADDTSPIPTDRVFFDYNYFNHAVTTGNGATIGLNRFAFGVEKTFLDGSCSIEILAPLETGLADNQYLDGTTAENQGTVFGNLAITLKCLVYQAESFAVSVGTIIDLPTAPNGCFSIGSDSLNFRNNSVHVAPFVGAAYAPSDNFFALGFVQLDFDTNGDPVDETYLESDPVIGRFRDPSLLYLDYSMGYWLFRDEPRCGRYLTGIAPVIELHYTTTMQNYRGIAGVVDPIYGGTDGLNLTAGLHFQMGPCSMLTVGGVVPLLTSDRDREFDSEVVVEFDRRF